ncbi:hypothetical protein DPEC_G00134640 [Dallia pectoralis]|uniref:Uncharacterized protein n=1 Tax=Dallia pectoralis TaxID=75939 RepID=A0ACC2GS41_DALPE|nr:hypothetical protein DPEC_G00134640 [Dallia pectoralis]
MNLLVPQTPKHTLSDVEVAREEVPPSGGNINSSNFFSMGEYTNSWGRRSAGLRGASVLAAAMALLVLGLSEGTGEAGELLISGRAVHQPGFEGTLKLQLLLLLSRIVRGIQR